MKKRIHITTMFIVITLLFIIGVYCVISGISISSNCENAIDIKDMTIEDLEEGVYVKADITSYVHNGITGVSSTLLLGLGLQSMDTYTISFDKKSYIQINIIDEQLKGMLEGIYSKSYDGKPICFVGEVVKLDEDISLEWYENVDKTIYPNLDNIIKKYAVTEVEGGSGKDRVITGVTCLIISIVLFIYSGGVKNGIVRGIPVSVKEKPVRPYIGSLNNENELYSEQMYLKFLEGEKLDLKKKFRFRLILLCVSATLQAMSGFINILLVVLACYSIYGLWCCFLNSENRLALAIVDRYNIRSNSVELAKCKRNIFELTTLIDERNRLEE